MKDFAIRWRTVMLALIMTLLVGGCGGMDDEDDQSSASSAVDGPTDLSDNSRRDQNEHNTSEVAVGGQPGVTPPPMVPPSIDLSTTSGLPSANETAGTNKSSVDSASDSASSRLVSKRDETEMKEVSVFYATDRLQKDGTQYAPPSKLGMQIVGGLFAFAVGLLVLNRMKTGFAIGTFASLALVILIVLPRLSPLREGNMYGPQRGELVHGLATVTVPASHQRGVVERPSILRLEFSEDDEKHVVLAFARELEVGEFYEQMSSKVGQSNDRDVLVFIHGYNVDFDSAIRRTAQIATDLGFQGAPVCYSWPSQGSMVGYTVDENNVEWTVPHLRDFLVELAEKSQAKSINIISHSMGNRAMTEALVQISHQISSPADPMFDQVVLAAPDVDADHFRNELAPQIADVARHVTLYASSDDHALVASKHLHGGYPRAGESGANLVVIQDVETIDVSGIDLSLLGHSYYGSNQSILQDLFGVVRKQLTASQRSGLIQKNQNGNHYWKIPSPRVAELEDTRIQ